MLYDNCIMEWTGFSDETAPYSVFARALSRCEIEGYLLCSMDARKVYIYLCVVADKSGVCEYTVYSDLTYFVLNVLPLSISQFVFDAM